MMSQQEINGPGHAHTGSAYGGYTADQTYAHQYNGTFSEQPPREEIEGKVYAPARDNKNMLRFLLAIVAMVMLLLFAILCMFFPGNTGGWISFCAASLAIFIFTAVAIDKIQ